MTREKSWLSLAALTERFEALQIRTNEHSEMLKWLQDVIAEIQGAPLYLLVEGEEIRI